MAVNIDTETRCELCRRTLLVGEASWTYREGRNRALHTVCTLCAARAERSGWEQVGDGRGVFRATRVRRTGAEARLDEALHEALDDVAALVDEEEVAAAAWEAHERELQAAIDAATRRIHELEAALAAEQQEHGAEIADLVRRHDAELAARDAALVDTERRIEELQEAQEALLRARRREADTAYLRGIAAEVFNRSRYLDEIRKAARRLGAPNVRVVVEGVALPRPVIVLFGWDGHWAGYRVTCDLVARLFDVEDISHGVADSAPPGGPIRSNAEWLEGKVAAA